MGFKKRLGMAMLGIAGLFGMRTPPEPEVIARTAPSPRPGGSAPPGEREFSFERGPRRRPGVDDAPDTPEGDEST